MFNETCEHPYAIVVCVKCGTEFCYACCLDQNVDQGGKYEPEYMLCPTCAHNCKEEV